MLTKGYIGGMTLTAAGAIALAVFMMLATTPLGIGPLGVTAWFLIALVGSTAVAAILIYAVEARLQQKLPVKRRMAESTRRGLFIGGFITIILAFSSLKQLNMRDIFLMALLLLLVEFYVTARS